jgi:hypothetical protein
VPRRCTPSFIPRAVVLSRGFQRLFKALGAPKPLEPTGFPPCWPPCSRSCSAALALTRGAAVTTPTPNFKPIFAHRPFLRLRLHRIVDLVSKNALENFPTSDPTDSNGSITPRAAIGTRCINRGAQSAPLWCQRPTYPPRAHTQRLGDRGGRGCGHLALPSAPWWPAPKAKRGRKKYRTQVTCRKGLPAQAPFTPAIDLSSAPPPPPGEKVA